MTCRNILIIGGGAWGTALAINLSRKLNVVLVVRSPKDAARIEKFRENTTYLPGVTIPPGVRVTSDLEPAMMWAQLVLIATPVSSFERVLGQIAKIRSDLPIIWGCKGICPKSGEPLSVMAESLLGPNACYGVLSGPCFASGLAALHPTAVVVATNSGKALTLGIARTLSNSHLRVYANSDLVGVQVCGAIKNVYAIAAGVIDGCGWSENTRAAMLTRAVAEAGLYLKKHKGKRSTLMGLSGFGDLYLTCSSRMSRNYQVGLSLAANIPLSQAVARLGHVAEGVATTRLIHQRASLLGVEMPIVAAVHQILDGGKTPQECAAILMARNITYEKRSSAAALGMISPDLV
jgi:glycerol-3-phosphate dehydrogenase (NAD(P)+)